MSDVSLTLSADEALVLFDLLAERADADSPLHAPDPAAARVLDALEAALERVLVEPFDAWYPELVARARERLAR